MKNKKNSGKSKKKIVIVIILIICILLLSFISYKLLNKEKNFEENFGENYSKDKINLTADEIIDLLSYIPYSLINMEYYNDAYHSEKVNVDNLLPIILSPILIGGYYDNYAFKDDKSDKFNEMLKKNNMEYGSIFLTSDLDEYLIKRYNLKLKSLKDISDMIEIKKLDNEYTAINYVKNGRYTVLVKTLISVDDGYVINDNAIITERTLFFQLKDDKCYVYKNSNIYDDKNIIKIYDSKDADGNALDYNKIDEMIKEDFKGYNYEFKHTYKKNANGYYYYSTEMVEIK